VTAAAHALTDAPDVDALARRIAGYRTVLIGEASHGTHEFYELRAGLTRRLVADHGFRAVALEADWPDTFRAHRYVTHRSRDADVGAALSDFRGFPAWMWRNKVMQGFVEWLRERNRGRRAGEHVDLRRRALELTRIDGYPAREEFFSAERTGARRHGASACARAFRAAARPCCTKSTARASGWTSPIPRPRARWPTNGCNARSA